MCGSEKRGLRDRDLSFGELGVTYSEPRHHNRAWLLIARYENLTPPIYDRCTQDETGEGFPGKTDIFLGYRRVSPHLGLLLFTSARFWFNGFLAVWRRLNDGQRFLSDLTSLFSRASQYDGCNATVPDAPLPLHFIGGASVAHVSSIHFNWGGVAMHFICICIGVRSWGFRTLVSVGAGSGRRTYCLPHARASSRRGYNPDGSCGCGPLYGNPVRHLVLADSASLFGRRRFGDFSRERSAARRPLVRRRDVPEEFMWALISDVKHPAGDALDEFLYGLDTEVASDNVI
ncbi:hypothetical protein EVAR_87523_1 [Eumeta japonica]|uniref:Uncharacterized protein n=1 Tax=Eumeta variegata TaxID=151549 RepID=A0A4C1XTN3_EUMVA|nr:hypothetical protein EVAR_87523_1 [Eumeta japonica]